MNNDGFAVNVRIEAPVKNPTHDFNTLVRQHNDAGNGLADQRRGNCPSHLRNIAAHALDQSVHRPDVVGVADGVLWCNEGKYTPNYIKSKLPWSTVAPQHKACAILIDEYSAILRGGRGF